MISMAKVLPDVSVKYGAPMGRGSIIEYPTHGSPLLYLRRVPLDSGGYDSGGAYWGLGDPLYVAFNDEYVERGCERSGEVFLTFRASTRDDAKQQIRTIYPAARFWR